jgi:hypothetical protein
LVALLVSSIVIIIKHHLNYLAMENLIYFFTRTVLVACLLVIAYLIAIPEKETADDWDIW